ncbi:MAG: hypothetical protein GY925_13850 [Actinomycetia bacterium]|nr:hypothetical protein [Actinomycetes bacterium]
MTYGDEYLGKDFAVAVQESPLVGLTDDMRSLQVPFRRVNLADEVTYDVWGQPLQGDALYLTAPPTSCPGEVFLVLQVDRQDRAQDGSMVAVMIECTECGLAISLRGLRYESSLQAVSAGDEAFELLADRVEGLSGASAWSTAVSGTIVVKFEDPDRPSVLLSNPALED